MSNCNWTAVYVTKHGGQIRFPLVEDENGKLFLKINGEVIPYAIGLNDSEHGTLVRCRMERITEQENTTEEKTKS